MLLRRVVIVSNAVRLRLPGSQWQFAVSILLLCCHYVNALNCVVTVPRHALIVPMFLGRVTSVSMQSGCACLDLSDSSLCQYFCCAFIMSTLWTASSLCQGMPSSCQCFCAVLPVCPCSKAAPAWISVTVHCVNPFVVLSLCQRSELRRRCAKACPHRANVFALCYQCVHAVRLRLPGSQWQFTVSILLLCFHYVKALNCVATVPRHFLTGPMFLRRAISVFMH